MSDRRWLVIDTETTGLLLPSAADLGAQPKIIELAIIEMRATETHSICAEKSWLFNPGAPLSAEIQKITGLTDEDLRDAPPFASILPEIIEEFFIGASGLVAHNLPFDLGMLVTELKRCGKEHSFPYPPLQLCTVSAYNHVKGRNMKLTELYHHVLGRPLNQTHRAMDDAKALAEIVAKDKILV